MPKKPASRKFAAVHEDRGEAFKKVMLSGHHLVTQMITGKTACGQHMQGWRYGNKNEVTCARCTKEG